ncbi:UNVERIFIED_CONTAM: hypothetical protein GTU68_059462 [Idotea baltica]|nr:hypothetical protein [Idotea baltica]
MGQELDLTLIALFFLIITKSQLEHVYLVQ